MPQVRILPGAPINNKHLADIGWVLFLLLCESASTYSSHDGIDMNELFLEDLVVGQTFGSGRLRLIRKILSVLQLNLTHSLFISTS